MLVALREFDSAPLSSSSAHTAIDDTEGCERYYTLYAHESTVTLVDVTDTRARKTINYDVLLKSHDKVFPTVVQPLLNAVLAAPEGASQAVIVVDGSGHCRRKTLFDPHVGLLEETAKYIMSNELVSSVCFSAVLLDDNNHLSDMFRPASVRGGDVSPSILEDTKEQFTCIEDAKYEDVSDATKLVALLETTRKQSDSNAKHYIYSFIISFLNPDEMPNTTVQFVSFAVSELSMGMKSTRHCVSTAASLIECQSPVLSFTGTKLTFLLKAALLGHQPGLWLSCFSPVSPPLDESRRETFKEAFCVAQTAARIYSSRQGLASGPSLSLGTGQGQSGAAIASVNLSIATSTGSGPCTRDSWRLMDDMNDAAAEKFSKTKDSRTRQNATEYQHLVTTPAATRSSAAGQTPVSTETPTDATYELETYKRVMEHAMEKLRADVKTYARQLEDTKRELAREKRKNSKSRSDVAQGGESALDHEEDLMLTEEKELESTTSQDMDGNVQLNTTNTVFFEQHTQHSTSREESAMLKTRVVELMDLLALLRQEIKDHVAKQKSYRERILHLEAAVRQRNVEIETLKQELDQRPEVCIPQVSQSTSNDATAVQQRREEQKRQQRLAEEVQRSQTQTAEVERRLSEAMDELHRERERRVKLENDNALLRRQASRERDNDEDTIRHVRSTYERQLTQLQGEMKGFKAHLEKCGEQLDVQANGGRRQLSYNKTSAPVTAGSGTPRWAYEPEQPTAPEADACDCLSSSRLNRGDQPRRTQSFEEFMQEEPTYRLRNKLQLSGKRRGRHHLDQ